MTAPEKVWSVVEDGEVVASYLSQNDATLDVVKYEDRHPSEASLSVVPYRRATVTREELEAACAAYHDPSAPDHRGGIVAALRVLGLEVEVPA